MVPADHFVMSGKKPHEKLGKSKSQGNLDFRNPIFRCLNSLVFEFKNLQYSKPYSLPL